MLTVVLVHGAFVATHLDAITNVILDAAHAEAAR
jgi:hypothetical protein